MFIPLSEIKKIDKDADLQSVKDAFNLHAFEVEGVEELNGDQIIDLDILPNRSSDSLSVRGILKEYSAIKRIAYNDDPLAESKPNFSEYKNEKLEVMLNDNGTTSTYFATLIDGIKVQDSPEWLREFMEKMGQKSINNIVDATNYVMFFLGQPMHAFDADKISNSNEQVKIGVRKAKNGEKFESLDGIEYELDESISVIFSGDESAGAPLGVAGVKGGKNSGVSPETTRIVLEAARFDPVDTRKTAAKLKLRTDASKRFENDIPSLLPRYAMNFAISLIKEIAGGEVVSVDYIESLTENPEVEFDHEKINNLLGTDISENEMGDILSSMGFEVNNGTVKAPFWRTDISVWQDLAEEIVRLYGFYNISSQEITKDFLHKDLLPNYYWSEKLREFFTRQGFVEITNSTLTDSGELELENSLASDKNFFRANLKDAVLTALEKNEKNTSLLGIYDAIKVFEIGSVYSNGKEKVNFAVGVMPIGKKKKESKADKEFEVLFEEFKNEFGIELEKQNGLVREFAMSVFDDLQIEGSKYPDLDILPPLAYKPFSQFPFVLRDIAVWLPADSEEKELEEVIKDKSGELLVRADIFDKFEKDGRVSYAYHLVFQSQEKTLTDDEINQIMQRIEKEIADKGWEVR